MAESTENVKQDTLASDESTKQQGSDDSYLTNEKQTPFMLNKTRNSIESKKSIKILGWLKSFSVCNFPIFRTHK